MKRCSGTTIGSFKMHRHGAKARRTGWRFGETSSFVMGCSSSSSRFDPRLTSDEAEGYDFQDLVESSKYTTRGID